MRQVVISGIGVVSPIGHGIKAFWEALLKGQTGMRQITRFSTDGFPTRVAAEISDESYLELLSEREIKYYSRNSQYALSAARLAMQDAGLHDFSNIKARIVTGSGLNSFSVIEEEINRNPESVFKYIEGALDPLGMTKAFMAAPAAALAMATQCDNNPLTISTACTSGLSAIGTGVELIKNRTADMVLCGGVDAPILHFILSAFCAARYFTTENEHPDKALMPFDARRTKCALGEGAAYFILEASDHWKIRRKAKQYCTVSRFVQQAENTNELFMIEKSGKRWAAVMRDTVRVSGAGVHVNAHATSDRVADKVEADALKISLGENKNTQVTSIKASTGSGLASAGVFQVATAAMTLKTGRIPGILNYEKQDEGLPGFHFLKKNEKIKNDRILVNSHGFGGYNAGLLLEKAKL